MFSKHRKTYLLLIVTFLTAVLLGSIEVINAPRLVSADGVQNYQGRLTIDAGTTAHTADWASTAWSQQGYGSAFIQVTQDITDATDSVTYNLYYSIDPVACGSVTNWSIGYDRIVVNNPAVAAGRYLSYTTITPVVPTTYISYTTQPTETNPITVTYNYATNTASFTETLNYETVAAVSATATVVDVAQSLSITGDGTLGIKFDTHGAWCAKLVGDLTTGRTVTSTIYTAPTDIYE